MAELNIDKIARDIADEIKQELMDSGAFIGRWIPVSEGLPEDFQRVLVTVERYNGDKVARVAEYNGRKRVFQIKENHEQWEVGEKGLLAWTPLPEPYKAESKGVLEQIAEEQNSLTATCKAWGEAIDKAGYVN